MTEPTEPTELGGPEVEDRYGTAARLAALERAMANHVRALEKLGNAFHALQQHLDEQHSAHARELRQLRARLQQLDDRDRWVDSYRADDRDPFRKLGTAGAPDLRQTGD